MTFLQQHTKENILMMKGPRLESPVDSSMRRRQFLLIELLRPQCGYKRGSWIQCCLVHYPQHWHLNYDFVLSSNVSSSGECKEIEWECVAVRSEVMAIRMIVIREFFYKGARFMWFMRHLGKVWQCCCHLWTLSQKREQWDEGICSKRRWPQMIYCRITSC